MDNVFGYYSQLLKQNLGAVIVTKMALPNVIIFITRLENKRFQGCVGAILTLFLYVIVNIKKKNCNILLYY